MKTIEQKVAEAGLITDVVLYFKSVITMQLNSWDNYTLENIINNVIEEHLYDMKENNDEEISIDDYVLTFDEVKPVVLQVLIDMARAGDVDCGVDNDKVAVWTRSDYFRDHLGHLSKNRIEAINKLKTTTTASASRLTQTTKPQASPVWPFPQK